MQQLDKALKTERRGSKSAARGRPGTVATTPAPAVAFPAPATLPTASSVLAVTSAPSLSSCTTDSGISAVSLTSVDDLGDADLIPHAYQVDTGAAPSSTVEVQHSVQLDVRALYPLLLLCAFALRSRPVRVVCGACCLWCPCRRTAVCLRSTA